MCCPNPIDNRIAITMLICFGSTLLHATLNSTNETDAKNFTIFQDQKDIARLGLWVFFW